MKKFLNNVVFLFFVLFGVNAFADDIVVEVDKDLGQKVLNAIDFPFEIRVPTTSFASISETAIGDPEIGDLEVKEWDKGDDYSGAEDFSQMYEKFILESVANYSKGSLDSEGLDPEEIKALNLLKGAMSESVEGTYSLLASKKSDVEKALKLLAKKKRFKFELIWVRVKVKERPDLKLSSPIELSKLKTGVKAKGKACVRVFGRWRCLRITTGWIDIEGKKLFLDMQSSGAKVMGTPRFSDLDIIIKIKIFGYTIRIPVGITTIVNRELRKDGPLELMDLSFVEQDIPYSAKKVRVETLTIRPNARGLAIGANMKVE